MALVTLRAADPYVVARLSAMSQLVGYTVGACGPLVVGSLDRWLCWSVVAFLTLMFLRWGVVLGLMGLERLTGFSLFG